MAVISSRYTVLEKLGQGGMGAVYLVYDKLRGKKVALKKVLISDASQRLALTREFRTLSALRHPNIVSVIEYGSHENQPWFTMEYLPESQSFDQCSERKAEQFIQVLQALGYLHRRGILHRDLKPGNILVTPDINVKLLDFGLAVDKQPDRTGNISGTLHYMAPELFRDEHPSVETDLWALGVMLCEAFAGHHPFDTGKETVDFILSVFSGIPDLQGISADLEPVIARLLSQDRSERYASAKELLTAFCEALDMPLPLESYAHRESFLQAAALVGRESELQNLSDAMKQAKEGKNQFWLIAGEAGSGKSRLLDELRTLALVDGFEVLQGQAVEGGGLPWQVWREPARKLVLGAAMSELTAAVLKKLVPDIDSLLEHPVATVPDLEPKANRDRLVVALLERIERLETPLLIILEDLHWASESLELLQALLPRLESKDVMVVGSFRNEEAPKLPESFANVQLLLLQRLGQKAVAELSASMIGAENTRPELVDRLFLETEGNPLFMVEVMRVLAEESGSLEAVRAGNLPEKILAGGMVAILKRRLEKIPTSALASLKLAAVIGRMLDMSVLKAAGVEELETWLQTCADAAVLEPYQGEWRFSHDRLREVLLIDLPEIALLHEKAAQAIETLHGENPAYAEALALHWRIAGDAKKEALYSLRAAQSLLEFNGDFERTESLVRRGLDLNLPELRPEFLHWLGYAMEKRARYAEATAAYTEALSPLPAPQLQASLLNRIGSVYWRQGQYEEAIDKAREAQLIAEAANEKSSLANSLSLRASVLTSQGDYAAAISIYTESLEIRRLINDRQGIAMNLNNLGNIAVGQGDYQSALTWCIESLEIRRAIGDRQGIAMSLNSLGGIAVRQGDNETALRYFQDALDLRRAIGDPQAIAMSLNNLGSIALSQKDYAAARRYNEESLQIKRGINDKRGIAFSLNNLGLIALHEQDYSSARQQLETSLQIRREIGDKQGIAMSLENLGILEDSEMDFQAARLAFEEGLAISHEMGALDDIVSSAAGLSIVLVQMAEYSAAHATLRETLSTVLELDAIPLQALCLLAMAWWTKDAEQAVSWLGLARQLSDSEINEDARFIRLEDKLRSILQDEQWQTSLERGKSQNSQEAIRTLLQELI